MDIFKLLKILWSFCMALVMTVIIMHLIIIVFLYLRTHYVLSLE